MFVNLWRLSFDLNFEKFVRSDNILDLHIVGVKLLVTCNHQKFGTFWNFDISSILESPDILDLITLLEYHVLLE